MFLIFLIIFIYCCIKVIKFSLKEISEIREYSKSMSSKEAQKKVIENRSIKNKFYLILFIFSLLALVVISFTRKNETKSVKKEETKVVANEKIENSEIEEKDPYKKIENNMKKRFSRHLDEIIATEHGVNLKIQAKRVPTKKMIAQSMLLDTREYIKEIEAEYKKNNLTYENLTLQFFHPMTNGKTSENMKVLQLNVDVEKDLIEVAFVIPVLKEDVEREFNK